jgi:uncharacterized protein YgiM (DUF1202 family)
MKKNCFALVILLAFMTLSGCKNSANNSTSTTKTPESIPSVSSVTATRLVTPSALPKSTPSPTATGILYVPLKATTLVDNLVLRTGPGLLFNTITMYKLDVTVTVIGKSQGGGWFLVNTAESFSGWMKADYLKCSGDANTLPFIAYPDASIITGHVQNKQGEPMKQVEVMAYSAANMNIEDHTVTDANGTYFLFLPSDVTGNYTVGLNTYACGSSAVDDQCQALYGYPSAQAVVLPFSTPKQVDFVLPNL